MYQRSLGGWFGILCLALASCGGGESASEAQAPMTSAAAVDATSLMDWAETHYSQLFPGHSQNQSLSPYVYRYYPATGNYLGLAGEDIYVLGPVSGGQLLRVGALSDFRCQVVPPACAGGSISGTAATGAPIAGALVTIKDGSGNTVTTTTSANGGFTASTQGLTAPLMLQVTTGSGVRLYSVTADSQGTTVANITPWTDLLLRSWYGVQAATPDTAFASPAAYPPPAPAQVDQVGRQLLAVAQLAINAHGSDIAQPADFISQPFSANGTGTDKFLDNTHVTHSLNGASVVLTMPSATQTLAVGYDSAANSLSLSSVTTNGSATTSASSTSVLPVGAAQAGAVDEINARLAAFAAVVNAKGASVTAADLAPFFAVDAVHDGLNRSQLLADFVNGFGQGQSVAVSIRRVLRLDLAAGRAEVLGRIEQSLAGSTSVEEEIFNLRKVAGTWVMEGNGRIAEVGVDAEARRNQGSYTQGSGPSVNVDVRPVEGTVSAVAVTGGLGSLAVQSGPTELTDFGVSLKPFYANTGPLAMLLPAGTQVIVTLTKTAGGTVSYTLPLNAFTTEQIAVTSPTGSGLAAANLGGTLAVAWTLPATYVVQRVQLSAFVFTGSQSDTSTLQCEVERNGVLNSSSTSGTITMPTTCGGQPVRSVSINVSTEGVNGERSSVIYSLQ
jgi:hypothetical protein